MPFGALVRGIGGLACRTGGDVGRAIVLRVGVHKAWWGMA